jgi:hypothetical protein
MCIPGATVIMGLIGQLPGIAKGVLDYEAKKVNAQVQNHTTDADAAKTIAVEELRGRVEERKALATLASHHDKLVGFIGSAFALHVWAYVLDAVFHLGSPASSVLRTNPQTRRAASQGGV